MSSYTNISDANKDSTFKAKATNFQRHDFDLKSRTATNHQGHVAQGQASLNYSNYNFTSHPRIKLILYISYAHTCPYEEVTVSTGFDLFQFKKLNKRNSKT